MRILFLAHRLPYPPNKGEKIRAFWELKTLNQRHEVDLFCFYDDPQDKFEISNLFAYCHSCYAEPLSPIGSRIRALSAAVRGESFSTGFFRSGTMTRRIAEAVQSQAYDLAFVFGSTMAQYVEPWPDLPKILDLVDVDSDKWVQYSAHSRGPLSWLWNREGRNLAKLESIFVKSFSNTLVCTEAEARLLRAKAQAGQISVLQNSLDLDYFRPESVLVPGKIRSLQPYVIFTGTMNYFPNVDAVQYFCMQVLPHIRSKASGLRFVIAGRNPSAAVRRLAADSAIEVIGAVPDIRPYLQGALVAVAPMRIARGVQNKILEALAMDIPVVASSIAAAALPPELAPLVEAEVEAEQFAARIADYALSPPRRNGSRRTSVSRYVETLDLPSQLEQLMQNAVADKTVEESEAGIAV